MLEKDGRLNKTQKEELSDYVEGGHWQVGHRDAESKWFKSGVVFDHIFSAVTNIRL